MRSVFLQLTKRSVKLTPVRSSGKVNYYDAPIVFDLPKVLLGQEAMANLPVLAAFVSSKLKGTSLEACPVIFCLDDEHVITKEFKHLPLKRAELEKAMKLEAEQVLSEDVDSYILLCDDFERIDTASGRLKNILYAVPGSLANSIYKEFRQHGVKVEKLVPPISGLLNSCKTILGLYPKSYLYIGKNVAVIDVGHEKIRMVLYNSGSPIFQKEYDSVYEDILQLLHKNSGLPLEEAAKEMKKPEFLLNGGRTRFGEETGKSIDLLLKTAIGEILRNMQVVMSSERLELNEMIFSGEISTHPDFDRFIRSLSLNIPFENIETKRNAERLGIMLDQQAQVQGCRPANFFTLNGLLNAKNVKCIDFLSVIQSTRGDRQASILLMFIISAAAVLAMLIAPVWLKITEDKVKNDLLTLSSPEVQEMDSLYAQQADLSKQLKAIGEDASNLHQHESSTQDILNHVQTQIAPNVVSINSCSVDNSTGTLALAFTVNSLDQYNAVRGAVAKAGYFAVAVPFSATLNTQTGQYDCTVTLTVLNYQYPFQSSAAGKSSSASSGKEAGSAS